MNEEEEEEKEEKEEEEGEGERYDYDKKKKQKQRGITLMMMTEEHRRNQPILFKTRTESISGAMIHTEALGGARQHLRDLLDHPAAACGKSREGR
jgi:hypothetical protein